MTKGTGGEKGVETDCKRGEGGNESVGSWDGVPESDGVADGGNRISNSLKVFSLLQKYNQLKNILLLSKKGNTCSDFFFTIFRIF